MSIKKNLTLATLAALLAVPAFGATNASQSLHISSVTAHADSYSQQQNEWTSLNNAITAHGGHSVRRSDEVDPGNGTEYNGNSIQLYQGGAYVNGQHVSDAQALAMFNGNSANLGSSNGTNAQNSSSTQYASKSELPQTGENNGVNKAAILGATTFTGLGLAALAVSKKHKDMAVEDVTTNNVKASNDKNNNPSNFDKSSYDMIMSNAFADINKDLENL